MQFRSGVFALLGSIARKNIGDSLWLVLGHSRKYGHPVL